MAEKVKKASTANAPRKTATAKTATGEVAAKKAAPRAKTGKAKTATMMVSREKIAQLAHHYFAQRGHQHGHHEEDWLRAERELLGKAS